MSKMCDSCSFRRLMVIPVEPLTAETRLITSQPCVDAELLRKRTDTYRHFNRPSNFPITRNSSGNGLDVASAAGRVSVGDIRNASTTNGAHESIEIGLELNSSVAESRIHGQ